MTDEETPQRTPLRGVLIEDVRMIRISNFENKAKSVLFVLAHPKQWQPLPARLPHEKRLPASTRKERVLRSS